MQNRIALLAAVLSTALLLSGCSQPGASLPAQSSDAPDGAAGTTAAEAAADATQMPMPGMEEMDHGAMTDASQPFGAQFIDSMIQHHQGAIAMSEQALEEAEHEELRSMAGEIIRAQEGEIEQMQAWRAEWYPDLPQTHGMAMAMGDMMLSDDTSIPFDRRFIEAMISHHQGAIAMAQPARAQAEHEELRMLADDIISAQEGEISQLREWNAEWYPDLPPIADMGDMDMGGTVASTPGAAALAAAVQGTVWVANEEGDSLTAVDAATNQVVTALTGIAGPHNVQVAPDGRTVWAVSGHDALAVAVDAQSYSLLGTVPVGSAPAHVVVGPAGATAWVSNSGDNTVTVIDAIALSQVATIPVGEFPHGLRPSPDGKWVAVANMRGNTVSLIDTATLTVGATIEVGAGPVQVAFAPDGSALYVTLNGEDAVAKIDLATRSVVGKAAVGDGPVQVYVTPDSRLILVANQGTEDAPGTTLSIVDASSMTEVATVETGRGAHGVAVEPSGRYAYVTNLYGDSLAVVDLAARAIVATVPTGASPNGVSFSPLVPANAAEEIALPISAHDETGQGSVGEAEEHEEHH